ncbi:DinB family protein [Actinoplanes sp. NPDC026670]|uniref:DinB family protein n=1 Tax=Actinoplanes sp. NPDC026670 TaxID=3154700 RepID=UPI0033DED0B2
MAATESDDTGVAGARFAGTDLAGARFIGADLSRAVLRGVDVSGMEIESPWLFEGGSLSVNGVDVVPLVEAELNRRFPGRADRRATDPDGLRTAWASLEHTWAGTLARVDAMPAGTVDVSVDGEWTFAQTLRHLVLATDVWLSRTVLDLDQPFHPLGLPHRGAGEDGLDTSVFVTTTPAYAEVLQARAGRVAMVRDFLATVTPDTLGESHTDPWSPANEQTTLACLHTILEEEWEHHRYAVRDLDAIGAVP